MNKNLGMLIYENAQPLDIIGPWEVFSFWKNILHAPLNMYLISEHGSYVTCSNGITLKSDVDFTHCPPLDYLIIPGGSGRHQAVKNTQLISFIEKYGMQSHYILSICTGAFLLKQTGLLKDEAITTYWRALPELMACENVHVAEERIVKSGKIWAAGGVSSGIDLALALIADIAGKETAGQVQLLLEYFPEKKLYTTMDTINILPAYENNSQAPYLPQYIRDYLKKNT